MEHAVVENEGLEKRLDAAINKVGADAFVTATFGAIDKVIAADSPIPLAGRSRLIREKLEAHPRAPARYESLRLDMWRFLSGEMADWKAVVKGTPWRRRAWRALRRSIPSLPALRDDWLHEFYVVVWSAQHAADNDDASRRSLNAARRPGPSKQQLHRMRRVSCREFKMIQPSESDAFLSRKVKEYRFSDASGQECSWWLTNRDLLRPTRGSGPRTQFDTPVELLMGFLIDSTFTRLPENAAATIVEDILRWTLGRGESADRLLRVWRWRKRHPERAPAQP